MWFCYRCRCTYERCSIDSTYSVIRNFLALSPLRACEMHSVCLLQLRPLTRERQGGGWVLAAAAAALDSTAQAVCSQVPESR
jgi:hypothetical protein